MRCTAINLSNRSFLVTVLTIFLVAPAYGAGEWDLGLALGYGKRSNPLINSHDIKQYWIADIAYYSDLWFFDNGDLGLVFSSSEDVSLNGVVSINSDRVYFSHMNENFLFLDETSAGAVDDLPGFVEAPDRDYAVELGLELIIDKPWGRFQSQLNSDISDTHGGLELWVDYSYDLLIQHWYIQTSLGVSWRSASLNDYYYGITPEDAIESGGYLPQYRAKEGINSFAKFSATYVISKQWRWVNSFQYERINSEAANSPIMTDDKITTVFTGLFYSFM